MAHRDRKASKVLRVIWAPVASMDLRDLQVKRAVLDLLVYLDTLVLLEQRAITDLEGAGEGEAGQERRDLQDPSATEEKGDRLVNQEKRESLVYQVRLDPKVTRDPPVLRVSLVNRVFKGHQDLLGRPGLADHRV